MKTTLNTSVSHFVQAHTVSAAMAEVERLEDKCTALREVKNQALALLREFRDERLATVSGEMDGDAGVCWTNEERARTRYDEACDELHRCQDDYWEALDYLSDEEREVRRTTLKARIAQGPAMVMQQAQQQQACAATRVAMRLQRTVTTHGIVAIDMASIGPCPDFPDHGRDEYRTTADGDVVRTRYVLASDHLNWTCPGAKPFITPNRSKVTARRTIDAVCECLSAPVMVQQQASDMRVGHYDPRAAAGARFPIWSGAYSDEELIAVVRPMIEQIGNELALSLVDGEIAAAGEQAVSATEAWISLCERRASGEDIEYGGIWDARRRMLDWHRIYVDRQEIEAIGDVGHPLTLHSLPDGIGVYRDGEDDPMLTLPRGITSDMAKLVVLTHRWAYIAGKDAGIEQAQTAMRRAMGLRA